MNEGMPPTISIESDDFHNCWYMINKRIMSEGLYIYDCPAEEKLTKDVCAIITLTGDAIKQIENKELHTDCKLKSGLATYLQQFVYDSDEYKKSNNEQKYTYAGRMLWDVNYITKCEHESFMYDRGLQLTTWQKYSDLCSDTRPCLQRVWIRQLTDDTCELHTTYRSHDAYGAWQFNNIGIYQFAKQYIIGKDVEVVKIVEFNDSLHIYDYDWDSAMNIRRDDAYIRRWKNE
jgi:hypothetical protein